MIGRVIITSVQKGLSDGPGFQPVVRTKTLEKPVVDYVLHETGYSHPFPPGDSRNPTIYSHRIATIHGKLKHFLIRTDDAISDYSGRSNRLSQCIVIDDSDLGSTQPGPCEILMGFPWETSWTDDKKPFLETVCPPWKIIDQPTPPCLAWQKATADAGWAGTLSLSVGQQQKAVLVTGLEHDVLTLFLEALALLPVQSRWGVTFSSCELDPTDALWKAVRRDINSKTSTSNSDLVLDLNEIKDRQQAAPESQLSARARGEAPKTVQNQIHYEEEQPRITTQKTQRISSGMRPGHIRNATTGKGRPAQNEKNQQTPSNQPGQDIFPNRHHHDRLKKIIVVLAMALVFAVLWIFWRENFFNGGMLKEVHVSNLSGPAKPIDLKRSPVHTKNLPDQATPSEGSAETQTPKQTTTQDTLSNEKRLPEELTKGHTNQETQEEETVVDKGNTKDTIRQPSQKEIEDELKNLMAASKQCSLPNVGLDNPQPIGIPWPVALSNTTTDIALSNDYSKNVVVVYQEKNKTWNVSAKKAGVSGTQSVPIAEISQRDEMLFWKWTPNSDRKTATAMLFSRLSFPKLDLAKPFIFRHAVEAKTKTYILQDCIPNGKDSMAKGRTIKIDDKFFINAHAQNNNQLNLSWTGLRDNDTLWKPVQLRMRLVSASFKLNDDVNPIDIKEILNSESPNTIRTVWSNEHLLLQTFCGLKVQPTIEVNIRDNGKGGWSASFTLKAVFIDDNTIPNNSFTNFLSDALESTDRTSSDIDALFKKNNYLNNYLNSDIRQSNETKNYKSKEVSFKRYMHDSKRTNDGSNGRGGALPGELSQKDFQKEWSLESITKVNNEYALAKKALADYKSNLLKEQKAKLVEIVRELTELRRESFGVTITCGLDSSGSKASGSFEIPLVGTK